MRWVLLVLEIAEVDRLQAPDLRLERDELLLPFDRIGRGRQRFENGRQLMTGGANRLVELLRAQVQALMSQPLGRQVFALLTEQVLDAMPLLLVATEFVVVFVERLARFDQLAIDQRALIEIGLALSFEVAQRIAARSSCAIALACFELGQLTCMRNSACSSDVTAGRFDSMPSAC